MIPKIVHYCWFGNNRQNALVRQCINSWKENLKDYLFVEWNQNRFDINENEYVKEAYKAKKYAFVSDYVRLKVLYNYGGIYLDTDTEVLKSFDSLLKYNGFVGFAEADEKNNIWEINTACIGAEPGNEWIGYLLSYYKNAVFLNDNGSYNTTTNSKIITEMSGNMFKHKNIQQTIEMGKVELFPRDYFDPIHPNNLSDNSSENSFAIHWHDCSWGRPNNNFERIAGFIKRKYQDKMLNLKE